MNPDETLAVLKQIKYDLSVLQTRVGVVIDAVANFPSSGPEDRRCPHCGTKFRSKLTRDEHVHNSHAGPVPEHYLAAERAAGFTDNEPVDDLEPGKYWLIPKATQ